MKLEGERTIMNSHHHGIERCRAIVRFPLEIYLPSEQPSDISQAAEAVKQEYRSSVKWKKLRCREVLPTDDGSVFKIDARIKVFLPGDAVE